MNYEYTDRDGSTRPADHSNKTFSGVFDEIYSMLKTNYIKLLKIPNDNN